MTAEIAIINKMAVALAADSAGSVGRKIHKSVNKLFMLSKYEPVGVMIYENLDFMGVPWETIIKLYREKLGRNKFGSLMEYIDDLFGFIEMEFGSNEEDQKEYFRKVVHYKFNEIKRNLNNPDFTFNIFKEFIDKYGQEILDSDEEKRNELFSQFYIIKTCRELSKKVNKYWNNVPKEFVDETLKEYNEIIEEEIKGLKGIALSKEISNHLKDIAIYSFYDYYTGVVIAGFGDDEVFPSVYSYTVGGIVKNKLKCKLNEGETDVITKDNPTSILTFAQHEMVDAFLEGVTPKYHYASEEYLEKIFEEYPKDILEIFNEIDDDKLDEDTLVFAKEKIKEIQEKKSELIDDYRDAMESVKDEHRLPILFAVINLPIDEMALMAESMVHITSLKRKVSFDQDESVGGSIDVAVISKGDGFVWIKRKHYFDPDLNHHFFKKYY